MDYLVLLSIRLFCKAAVGSKWPGTQFMVVNKETFFVLRFDKITRGEQMCYIECFRWRTKWLGDTSLTEQQLGDFLVARRLE